MLRANRQLVRWLQPEFPAEKQRDHFALAYVALGDAYVKNRAMGLDVNLAEARQVWESGLKKYPNFSDLEMRLKLMEESTDDLIEFVESIPRARAHARAGV